MSDIIVLVYYYAMNIHFLEYSCGFGVYFWLYYMKYFKILSDLSFILEIKPGLYIVSPSALPLSIFLTWFSVLFVFTSQYLCFLKLEVEQQNAS